MYSFESGGTSFHLPPEAGGSGELSADSGSLWNPTSGSTREKAPFCSPLCDSRPLLMVPSLPRRLPMEDVGRPMEKSHDLRPSPRGTKSKGTLRGSAASKGAGVRGPVESPRAESKPRAEACGGWCSSWSNVGDLASGVKRTDRADGRTSSCLEGSLDRRPDPMGRSSSSAPSSWRLQTGRLSSPAASFFFVRLEGLTPTRDSRFEGAPTDGDTGEGLGEMGEVPEDTDPVSDLLHKDIEELAVRGRNEAALALAAEGLGPSGTGGRGP
mmetsp:Transcript_61481/g.109581  ORF Transcript_61481/g.109581 Transcript_61481/m.109581 type:complete len:269 (+) Transcript_61481:1030-1836(+)